MTSNLINIQYPIRLIYFSSIGSHDAYTLLGWGLLFEVATFWNALIGGLYSFVNVVINECTTILYLQLLRDSKVSKICNVMEALIEALLEHQAYSEVQVS